MVRVGSTQKKLLFNLRRLRRKITVMEDGEPSPSQAGQITEPPKAGQGNAAGMSRLSIRDVSLNAPRQRGGGGEWQDFLIDEFPSPEDHLADEEELAKRRSLLKLALGTLAERERDIFIERGLKEERAGLNDLGRRHNISRERVRQIEVTAYEKVKTAIQRAAANDLLPVPACPAPAG